jgi:hypothetical protein
MLDKASRHWRLQRRPYWCALAFTSKTKAVVATTSKLIALLAKTKRRDAPSSCQRFRWSIHNTEYSVFTISCSSSYVQRPEL